MWAFFDALRPLIGRHRHRRRPTENRLNESLSSINFYVYRSCARPGRCVFVVAGAVSRPSGHYREATLKRATFKAYYRSALGIEVDRFPGAELGGSFSDDNNGNKGSPALYFIEWHNGTRVDRCFLALIRVKNSEHPCAANGRPWTEHANFNSQPGPHRWRLATFSPRRLIWTCCWYSVPVFHC